MFNLDVALAHVKTQVEGPEGAEAAEEIVTELRREWSKMDPKLAGQFTKSELRVALWCAAEKYNTANNMPMRLPRAIEKLYTEIVAKSHTGPEDNAVIDFWGFCNYYLLEEDISITPPHSDRLQIEKKKTEALRNRLALLLQVRRDREGQRDPAPLKIQHDVADCSECHPAANSAYKHSGQFQHLHVQGSDASVTIHCWGCCNADSPDAIGCK